MTRSALVDAGPLVAILCERDQHHEACVEALRGLPQPLLTCWPVLAEACYLLETRVSASSARDLLSVVDGEFLKLVAVGERDVPTIESILAKYKDQGLQLADAMLMHLAEREKVETIFTTDKRHFQVFAPASGKPPRLIP